MPILGDNTPSGNGPSPEMGAHRIKRLMNQMCPRVASDLEFVRKIVERHGRAAIDEALGEDAAEFASFYTTAQTFAATHPNCTVEDLPS